MDFRVAYNFVLPEILRREGVLRQLMYETLYKVSDDLREYLYTAVFRGKPYIRYENRQDRIGRSLVKYSVYEKGSTINASIGSYPNNLFERGRRTRSGRQQPALNIFSKVLPPIADQFIAKRRREIEGKFTQGTASGQQVLF